MGPDPVSRPARRLPAVDGHGWPACAAHWIESQCVGRRGGTGLERLAEAARRSARSNTRAGATAHRATVDRPRSRPPARTRRPASNPARNALQRAHRALARPQSAARRLAAAASTRPPNWRGQIRTTLLGAPGDRPQRAAHVLAHAAGGSTGSRLARAATHAEGGGSSHAFGRATEFDPLRRVEALPGRLLPASCPVHWTGHREMLLWWRRRPAPAYEYRLSRMAAREGSAVLRGAQPPRPRGVSREKPISVRGRGLPRAKVLARARAPAPAAGPALGVWRTRLSPAACSWRLARGCRAC